MENFIHFTVCEPNKFDSQDLVNLFFNARPLLLDEFCDNRCECCASDYDGDDDIDDEVMECVDMLCDVILELEADNKELEAANKELDAECGRLYSNYEEIYEKYMYNIYTQETTDYKSKYEKISLLFDKLMEQSREIVNENKKLKDVVTEYEVFERQANSILEGADVMMEDYNSLCIENEKLRDALAALGYRIQ